MNAITGGKHNNKPQSGLGGLASSFLGGQSSHGGGSGGHNGGSGGLTGKLVGSLLGGGKPHSNAPPGGSGVQGSSSSGHSQGGLMGMASGLLGGHGSSVRLIELHA